jgi:ATP phosphoribosyltransferase regulatory subunit HisZ
MTTFLLATIVLLLLYLSFSLKKLISHIKNVDERVKAICERQESSETNLEKIKRTMEINFKQVSDNYSEAQFEEIVKSRSEVSASIYRRLTTTDSYEEAHAFVRNTAARLGVSLSTGDKTET